MISDESFLECAKEVRAYLNQTGTEPSEVVLSRAIQQVLNRRESTAHLTKIWHAHYATHAASYNRAVRGLRFQKGTAVASNATSISFGYVQPHKKQDVCTLHTIAFSYKPSVDGAKGVLKDILTIVKFIPKLHASLRPTANLPDQISIQLPQSLWLFIKQPSQLVVSHTNPRLGRILKEQVLATLNKNAIPLDFNSSGERFLFRRNQQVQTSEAIMSRLLAKRIAEKPVLAKLSEEKLGAWIKECVTAMQQWPIEHFVRANAYL